MKKITIEKFVPSCRTCPYVTNSSKEHDDPFTSEPHPTTWWCTSPKNKGINENFIIMDPYKVDDKCPE